MPDSSWQYETADDLDQTLVERLRKFPRRPDMLIYGLRSISAIALRAWLRSYHRLRIVGRENLPAAGSFVLVANHTSHLDALCLLSALPLRRLHQAFPAAAQDYFFTSLPRVALSAVFINALPFARKVHIRQSLDLCRRLLEQQGNILILFPEGKRSNTGQMDVFRSGIGYLIAGTEIPVVPCALRGAWESLPKNSILPRPRRIQLIIGKPRLFSNLPPGRESADKVAHSLQTAVGDLRCE